MLDIFDSESLDELSAALAGTYSMTLCGGAVRLLCRQLPGRTVSALLRISGVLYVILDLDKPCAVREAWTMIQEWRTSYVQPRVSPDGSVDLIPLARLPEPPGPASLTFAGG